MILNSDCHQYCLTQGVGINVNTRTIRRPPYLAHGNRAFLPVRSPRYCPPSIIIGLVPRPRTLRSLALPSATMTTLPSFVELMASLGLENSPQDGKEGRPSHLTHSRSSSHSSTISTLSQSSGSSVEPNSDGDYDMDGPPYIVVSSSSNQTVPRDVELDKKRHRVRYSPYMPAISHIRRSSLPNASPDNLQNQPPRALSSSPRSTSPLRGLVHRTSKSTLSSRVEKKLTLDADLIANTPISTFVRLRSPQSSPISPTFPTRKRRATAPSVPVSIPTLPQFCFPAPASASNTSPASDTDEDALSDAPSRPPSVRRPRQRRSTGVQRVSSQGALQELAEAASQRNHIS